MLKKLIVRLTYLKWECGKLNAEIIICQLIQHNKPKHTINTKKAWTRCQSVINNNIYETKIECVHGKETEFWCNNNIRIKSNEVEFGWFVCGTGDALSFHQNPIWNGDKLIWFWFVIKIYFDCSLHFINISVGSCRRCWFFFLIFFLGNCSQWLP